MEIGLPYGSWTEKISKVPAAEPKHDAGIELGRLSTEENKQRTFLRENPAARRALEVA
jgi:hypothetical protein